MFVARADTRLYNHKKNCTIQQVIYAVFTIKVVYFNTIIFYCLLVAEERRKKKEKEQE
jgi:hypothetical protein